MWEFALSVCLGFVVGVCHVMFDGLLFLKRWHCVIGTCGVFMLLLEVLFFFSFEFSVSDCFVCKPDCCFLCVFFGLAVGFCGIVPFWVGKLWSMVVMP